jgi:hypothetical protein
MAWFTDYDGRPGTFQATIVTVTTMASWEGIRTRQVDRAWFAWGIGLVQEQVFTTSAGHNFPAQVEDLKSFTKE